MMFTLHLVLAVFITFNEAAKIKQFLDLNILPNDVENGVERTFDDVRQTFLAENKIDLGDYATSEYWTPWRDGRTDNVVGDLENTCKWMVGSYAYNNNYPPSNCEVWCRTPLALEWKPAEQGISLKKSGLISKCSVLDPLDMINKKIDGSENAYRGFNCYNIMQSENNACTDDECEEAGMYSKSKKRAQTSKCNMCANFQVRYLCPEKKPDSGKCPTLPYKCNQSKRQLEQNFEGKLQELDDSFRQNEREAKQLIEREADLEKEEQQLVKAKREKQEKVEEERELTRLIKKLHDYLQE